MLKVTALACAALVAVGCGKSNSDKTPASAPGLDAGPSRLRLSDIDKLRWAGAIIIEAGEGKGLFAENKPKFRVYICLEKTNNRDRNTSATIDFNELGLDIQSKINLGEKGEQSLTRKYDKLKVRVKYRTKVEKEYGYAYSKIQAEIISVPSFSVVSQVGDFNAEQLNSDFSQMSSTSISYGDLGSAGSSHYPGKDGQPDMYIMNSYENIGADYKDSTLLRASKCEGQDKRVVVERF